MNYSISNNAEWASTIPGDRRRGEEGDEGVIRAHPVGEYARLILENRAGAPTLNAKRRPLAEHDTEKVGEKLAR